jgi:hypothetical protein
MYGLPGEGAGNTIPRLQAQVQTCCVYCYIAPPQSSAKCGSALFQLIHVILLPLPSGLPRTSRISPADDAVIGRMQSLYRKESQLPSLAIPSDDLQAIVDSKPSLGFAHSHAKGQS